MEIREMVHFYNHHQLCQIHEKVNVNGEEHLIFHIVSFYSFCVYFVEKVMYFKLLFQLCT